MADPKIIITADTSQAERSIDDLKRAIADIDKVGNLAAKGLAAITAAGAAMAYAIGSSIQSVGELNDAANALGMSAQNLKYLQQSAQLAGIGADELNSSLRRLQANLGDALIKGTGPAVDAMRRLGVSLEDVVDLPADQQMKRIGEALQQIPNPAERSALAMDLMGKQGPKLIAAAEAMDRIKERTKELGLALSDLDIKILDQAGDSMDELGFIIKGAVTKAAAALAPYIIAVVEEIRNSIKEAGGFEVILGKVRDAIELAAKAAAVLATFFVATRLTAGIMAAVGAMTQMYAAIKVATGAAGILNAVLGKNPIVKIVGALMAIGGAVVAIKQVDDLFADLDKKAESVKNNVASQVKEEQNTVTQKRLYNDEQEKALIALGDTLTKLYTSVQHQKDINQYGQLEADIRKGIKEEQDKLAKVGLTLTDQQQQLIRGGYTQLDQAKTLNTLRKEQANAIKDSLTPTNALSKELNKMAMLKFKFVDQLTDEEITKTMEDMYTGLAKQIEKDPRNKEGKPTWQLKQEAAIKDTIDAEIFKYNQLIGIDKKYLDDHNALNVISEMNRLGVIKLTIEQQKQLNGALLQLDLEYTNAKEANRLASIDRINQAELTRIQQLMGWQKDLSAFELSEDQKRTFSKIRESDKIKANIATRIEFEKKSDLEKAQFAIDQGAQMYTALGAQNKKAFEAAKAFNIANAIINTYAAATKALATYPPPFSFIAAAAAVGMGLAQVAQIRAQSYSGKALGGPVMGGQPYLVGESGPEIFTPNTTGNITRNSDIGGGGPTNVNFTIVANDAQGFDDLLLQRRGMITQMISDAMLERGSRSMV